MRILFLAGAGMGNLILATPAFQYITDNGHDLTIHPGSLPKHVTDLIPFKCTPNPEGCFDVILQSHFYDGPGELNEVMTSKIISIQYHHSTPEYLHYLKLSYFVCRTPYSITPMFHVEHNKCEKDPKLITLAPTATPGQPVKRWGEWVALATILIQKGYHLQVLATHDDLSNLGEFPHENCCIIHRPLSHIPDLIASSALTIANDCGLAHISHATQTKTLVLSGPVPPVKSLPPGVHYLMKQVCPFQPCYRNFDDWNLSHEVGRCQQECLYAISPAMVYNKVKELLSGEQDASINETSE